MGHFASVIIAPCQSRRSCLESFQELAILAQGAAPILRPTQFRLGEDPGLVALRMAWDRVVDALSVQVSAPTFQNTVKQAVPLEYVDGKATLGAKTKFCKHWIDNKLCTVITDLLTHHLGTAVTIEVKLMEDDSVTAPEEKAFVPPAKASKGKTPDFVLNEGLCFDNFVVGDSNRLAYGAATAVAKAPGQTYNPLFIYGGSGLGKTHLLHSIGLFVRQFHPDCGLMYISAERFTGEYVQAVSDRRVQQFRRRYRSVDVWLVDDVQFLAGKERTKEEFFHTFNTLHEMGRQIVLTSDLPPKDLELEERLQSRFEAGLVADIAPPELETRMAIIKSKAQKRDLQIPAEVVLYLAKLVRSNVRSIEGALLRLHAVAQTMSKPVTTELATDVLERYYEQPPEVVITPEAVQELVARHFSVDVRQMNGPQRDERLVIARQVAMYMIRQVIGCSYPAIGKAFGGKDHTTVLHAVRKISKLIVDDPNLADDIESLMKRLKSSE